jgi:hypothetical protein
VVWIYRAWDRWEMDTDCGPDNLNRRDHSECLDIDGKNSMYMAV